MALKFSCNAMSGSWVAVSTGKTINLAHATMIEKTYDKMFVNGDWIKVPVYTITLVSGEEIHVQIPAIVAFFDELTRVGK